MSSSNSLHVFDVDGVLTDRGMPIDLEFQEWFIQWGKTHQYGLLTGSDREKSIHQIGEDIVNNASISCHCMGNHIFFEGEEYFLNQFSLTTDELSFIEQYVQNSPYTFKNGNHIAYRKGSINVSIAGRDCDDSIREHYRDFDTTTGERLNFIDQLTRKFPRLEGYLGGDTSIDICIRGGNKGNAMQLISFLPCHGIQDVYFYGDRIYEGGIDYPVTHYLPEFAWTQIDAGYHQIKGILEAE